METLEQAKRNAADLYWLAAVLTGNPETASDLTVQAMVPEDEESAFFSTWMDAWSRRIFIAKALAAVRDDLVKSARRTALMRVEKSDLPPRSWAPDEETSRLDLERALLQIDLFPRAAVLLLALERMPLSDAAVLLDADLDLIRKALAIGARDLTIQLARMQGWEAEPALHNAGA